MADSEPIISVSGLRGIVGQSLTPLVVAKYVAAFAATIPRNPVIVTRDGRATGSMLADVVCGTLRATGHRPLYADVAATPTTGVLVRQHQAVGGIQISASHNPPEYNGLKLFNAHGRVINAEAGTQVLKNYRQRAFQWAAHQQVERREEVAQPGRHLELVLTRVDAERIREKKFRVVLDANHGAGSLLGRALLNELACHVTLLGDVPDGQFAHPPEPTAENLLSVSQRIGQLGADIGFCQDPDADRLAIIDHAGNYIGEEMTLAICVDHVLSKESGPVVTNCSTSRMCEDIAAARGVPFFRSKVGEANVADLMIEKNAVFGGEGNGGPIDPQVGYVRDSFVGMALVLEAMATHGETVAEIVGRLPKYAMVKTKVDLAPELVNSALAALAQHFSEARSDTLDGLRLDWPGKWLLVRASNTEPIVRLMAECPTDREARELCQQAASVIAKSSC